MIQIQLNQALIHISIDLELRNLYHQQMFLKYSWNLYEKRNFLRHHPMHFPKENQVTFKNFIYFDRFVYSKTYFSFN
jgi:hypothetical protein